MAGIEIKIKWQEHIDEVGRLSIKNKSVYNWKAEQKEYLYIVTAYSHCIVSWHCLWSLFT